MKKILVLCTGNSCRSQIAQGYLQHYLGNSTRVFSAGLETHGVNPRAVQVMKEDGIDISHHTSNHLEEYLDIPFDLVLTVCDHAKEHCPLFPGNTQKLHQNFKDPAKAIGSDEEVLNVFREVRDQIKSFTKNLALTLQP